MNPRDERAPDRYRSVRSAADIELIVEKSRFLAHIAPVESEEAALAFVANLRATHPDATHVVPAWIIGPGGLCMRTSDDGEPSGTAGAPTLEVLRRENLTDVVCATVRYFGGIKLGAGGLIRAYSRAASEAVQIAGVAEMVRQQALTVTLPYNRAGAVTHQLEQQGHAHTVRYDADVHIDLFVPDAERDAFVAAITNRTDGRAVCTWGAWAYAPLNDAII